jgi:recombination protein RecA
VGVDMGLVKKSGAFFSYNETRLGQGRENAKEFLRQNTALRDQIEREIRGTASDFALMPELETVEI